MELKKTIRCKCHTCHQEFANSTELRRHIGNRPPTCRPPPPNEWTLVDASSKGGNLGRKHPNRNWFLFRKQAYTRGINRGMYMQWHCITKQQQGCWGSLKISKDDRVTQVHPCHINHFEYNLESTSTQNCQMIRLVSIFCCTLCQICPYSNKYRLSNLLFIC